MKSFSRLPDAEDVSNSCVSLRKKLAFACSWGVEDNFNYPALTTPVMLMIADEGERKHKDAGSNQSSSIVGCDRFPQLSLLRRNNHRYGKRCGWRAIPRRVRGSAECQDQDYGHCAFRYAGTLPDP